MPTTRKRATYHHGDLKNALLEASLEVLGEQGLEGLTVAEVGRRTGVSSAAPYKHFADRQALLRAVAAEGNRRLGAAIVEATRGCTDPVEAFRLSGVAYIRWAAENPAIFRLTTDPTYIDFGETPAGVEEPEALEGTLEPFWRDLAKLVRSGGALPASHPLIEQLRGRALAQGLATLFVGGVFGALGITSGHAERIARAVTGEDMPPLSQEVS